MMQRLHDDDLSGFLLKNQPEAWMHINIPAIANDDSKIMFNGKLYCNRIIGDVLHKDRESENLLQLAMRDLGEYGFAAQYQQNPTPANGNIIKLDWLRYYSELPLNFDAIYISLDCAKGIGESNDYTAICIIGCLDDKHYLIQMVRKRVEYPDLKRLLLQYVVQYKPDAVLIEDSSNGGSLIQDVKADKMPGVIAIKPKYDKIFRFNCALIAIESGDFLLPKEASFMSDLISEMAAFPNGKHDDQVDSIGQYFLWQKTRKALVSVPKIRII
jgi:predicted phage terminase large subunit-like protein